MGVRRRKARSIRRRTSGGQKPRPIVRARAEGDVENTPAGRGVFACDNRRIESTIARSKSVSPDVFAKLISRRQTLISPPGDFAVSPSLPPSRSVLTRCQPFFLLQPPVITVSRPPPLERFFFRFLPSLDRLAGRYLGDPVDDSSVSIFHPTPPHPRSLWKQLR